MSRPRPPLLLRRAAVGAAVGLSLVAGFLAAPAHAAPGDDVPANTECPGIMSASDLDVGDTGTGLTVVTGTDPQPFAVKVLGVLENGIGADRDMIVVEVSDLPGRNVIGAGDGIWSGMSGSPVYVGGKLIGAVAYGFSLAPSRIGGITPAADMADLLELPVPAAVRKAAAKPRPAKVDLSAADRRAISARASVKVPSGSLEALPTPTTLSGLSSKRIKRFQATADKAGLNLIAHAGSTAAAPSPRGPLTEPTAGGNFGAALSYGDLTAAGIGTTTLVCGSEALALGHPFNYAGPVNYGANDANSLAIVKDATFGPFKMAGLTAPFGRVDQDRLAGLRADLGRRPYLLPIGSTITNVDTGKRRQGETLAADTTLLPALTFYGLLASYDTTFDEFGGGRASTAWTITGRRAGGKPFTLTRSNRVAAVGDVSGEASFEPASAVDALLSNEFEPVTLDEVSYTSRVSTNYRDYAITKMEVSVDGGKYTTPKVLRVKGGALLRTRVTLRPYKSTALKTTTITMRVPRQKGRQGVLRVTGGATLAQGGDEDEVCLVTPEECEETNEPSFNSLLADIAGEWRNDVVAARLRLDADEPGQRTIRKVGTKRQSEVVYGDRSMEIVIR